MNWSGPLRTICLAAFIIIFPVYDSFAQHGSGFHGAGGSFHSGNRGFGAFPHGGELTTFHGGGVKSFHRGGYGYYGSLYHGGYYPHGRYHPYYGAYPYYYGYAPYAYGFSIGFGFGPFWGYWGSPYAYAPYPVPSPNGYYRDGGPYNNAPGGTRSEIDYRRTVPRAPRNTQDGCDYRYEGTCSPSKKHHPPTQQQETLPEDAPRVYLIKNPAQ